MEARKQSGNPMGTKKVPLLLLKMAIPMIFSMVVSALYNIVDSIFIGMIEAPFNEKAITALGYAFPLQMLLVAVAIGTGIGVNSVLSKALGQNKKDDASSSCINGYCLMAGFYLVFLTLGLIIFFSNFYFSAVTDDEMVVAMGSQYLGICFIFSFAQLLQLVTERSLCATGKTSLAMVMQLSGALVNIALDPLFILVLDMGVEGAAIATVLGQVVSMIVGFLLNVFANKEITFRKKDLKPSFSMMGSILKVGLPGIILQALQSLQSLVLQFVFMVLLSGNPAAQDMLVGVYGVYYKLQNFVFMAFYGLINALLPIVAFNYGNKDKKRVREAILYGYLYGAVLALVGIVLFESIPEALLLLFNLGSDWVDAGVKLTRITAPTFLLASFCIVSTGILEGFGNGVHPMILSAIRLLIALFPSCYGFGYFLGTGGIWWGSYVAEGAAFVYSALVVWRVYRSKFPLAGNSL